MVAGSTKHGCKHGLGIFGAKAVPAEPLSSVIYGIAKNDKLFSSPHGYYIRIFDIRILSRLRKLKGKT